ncbi:MAG TPA: hypothetical protein VGQ38_05870 [Gaiellaceae bacterium]|nr:hypothetical protein [Gaiellaceae bacterium]
MRDDGGGGGGRILIDPTSLKASASRVKSAGHELSLLQTQLGSVAMIDLPPSVAGVVQDALSSAKSAVMGDPLVLESAATELTRRAFWAEYADQVMAGYPLSGEARKEFVAWMKDGTLLQYADRWEAEGAGRELANLYKGFRDDPQQLIDLAACLKGAERWGSKDIEQMFGAGFVNQFGAKNMETVPRMIQAMEWSRQISGDMSMDQRLLRDVAMKWEQDGGGLHEDPINDLLAPFSLALANATASGQLTRQVEDDIANNDDTWSTAQLVSQGTFSKQFLLKVFKTGVLDKIVSDSRYDSVGGLAEAPQDSPYTIGNFWSNGHNGLPYDTKQIVLDALARNPDAAAAAFTQHLDVQPWDRFGQQEPVSNTLDLLYKYGHFQDGGKSFGHAYSVAADQLNLDHGDLVSRGEGANLTKDAINLVLGDDNHVGGMDAFKDGLATDLAHNHVQDLFSSALSLGSAQGVDVHHGVQIGLQGGSLDDLLKSLADRPSSLQTILHSASIYQGALIHDGTAQPPGSSAEWAYKAAAFDAHVLNATELKNLADFNAEDERHQLVAGFFKDVINDSIKIENPLAGTIVHNGVDSAIDGLFPGPDISHVIIQNSDAKALMTNSLHASIAGGYYEHGQLGHDGKPPSTIAPDGRLVSYGDTTEHSDARWDYEQWMNGNSEVERVAQPALSEVSRAFQERAIDLVN